MRAHVAVEGDRQVGLDLDVRLQMIVEILADAGGRQMRAQADGAKRAFRPDA